MNKKQVITIHGGEAWNSYEEYIEYLKNYEFTEDKFNKLFSKGWKDNLQDNLEEGFLVVSPSMPSKRNAKYLEWAIWFEKLFPYLQEGVILVGHSLGANFLTKYLSENKLPVSIEQLHLVAGCFGAGGGFELSDDLSNVEAQCGEIYIYHSKDDFVVDFSDGKKYAKALPTAHFMEFEDRNHFLQEEFPELVDKIKHCDTI